MHSHYNQYQHQSLYTGKVEKNKIKLLWWKITYRIEDWYDEVIDFIDYVKRYKSN